MDGCAGGERRAAYGIRARYFVVCRSTVWDPGTTTTMYTRSIQMIAGVTVLLTPGLKLYAQSIQQGDLLPPMGATWHMRSLQALPDLPEDALPTIWPFGDVVGNDVYGSSFSVLSPSVVPASTAYPGTDRVLREWLDGDGGATHTFLDVQSQRCLTLASNSALISTTYSPGGLFAAYPMELGEPITGSFCASSASPTSLTPYCGETEMIFLKTGLLQLPFGEFEDTRLIRTRRIKVNQTDPTDSTMTETLTWFTPGLPYPLLQLSTVNYANGDQARSGQILDELSVVGLKEVQRSMDLRVFPVPSAGDVFVDAPNGGDLRIFAADGRSVYETRLAATATPVRLPMAGRSPGVYHGVLQHNGSSARFRFVLE